MMAGFSHHGGRLVQARARFGGKCSQWLDLSTGINPMPWQTPVPNDVDWRSLPNPVELQELEEAAAKYFGCDPALCVAVPGSETGLRLVGRSLALPGLHQPLVYGTYRAAFAQSAEIADLAMVPRQATALILGNPNNPDGQVLSRASLLALLAHQEGHEGWLIVDEAFADCDPNWSVAADVAAQRRLVVLRSFGKFFGLAGLRLGFAVAPPEIVQSLRHALGDWPVHAAALTIGAAAYADEAWIRYMRRHLAERAAVLDKMLRRQGLTPGGGCPLFRLITGPGAGDLFEPLARRHVLTRPFAGHSDLLRLGLPPDEAGLEQLEYALKEVCRHG